MRNSASPTPESLPTHDVPVLDHHFSALFYLARIDRKSIRQLVGRAIVDFLKSRGVYITARGMLDRCPLCQGEMSDRTVARYLLVKKVWICGPCHRQINREFELWVRQRAPQPLRAQPARR